MSNKNSSKTSEGGGEPTALETWRRTATTPSGEKVTQALLAEVAGCHQTFISHCCLGKRTLGREHIERICNTFSIDPAVIGYQITLRPVVEIAPAVLKP